MNKVLLFFTGAALIMAGCVSRGPEHYQELTEKERSALQHTARALALRGNAVPDHLRNAFVKLAPHERIVYDGDKHGKAAFRWEIYERRRNANRITQKDVNPYWIMVYAIGDLRDPSWKLNHANSGDINSDLLQQPGNPMPGSSRQIKQVRYRN